MNDQLRHDYEMAKDFWNTAFLMDEDAKQQAENCFDENGWKNRAPSEKLLRAAESLGRCGSVLDYGCGSGWGAVIAAKSGCHFVTAVDVSANAAKSAEFYAKLYGVNEHITTQCVPDTWLNEVAAETYDGIFCSNVLDVIPESVSERIVANFARIARKNAQVIIGMNYYMEPMDNPERNMTVKNGNHVFVNDILRLVCHTDEEWIKTFSRYFTVDRLEHFAWPGEETERRRLFFLRKK